MSKKILIFSLIYDPYFGGAEVAIKEITNRIKPKDYEFHMVTLRIDVNLPQTEQIGNILVHRIGFGTKGAKIDYLSSWPGKINRIMYPLMAFWKAWSLHKQHHYHGMWSMLAYYGALAARLVKLVYPTLPYLLEFQNGRSYEQRKKMFGPYLFGVLQKSVQKADYIKCISNFLVDVSNQLGATTDPLLVPNGVSVKHFGYQFTEQDLEPIRSKLQLQKDITYVITATRLVEERGLDAMIRGLKHLPEQVYFILCGTGPYEKTLKDMAAQDGVADRIIWAGHVDYQELPKYLAVADIFARPSIYEGMGNAFVEAMVAGLPTVATPVGGITDFLFEEPLNPGPKGLQTGYLCEVDNPRSFAEAIERVLADPNKATRVAQAGKQYASSRYEWDNIAQTTKEKIFDQF